MTEDHTVTVREAADRLGVSVQYIRKLIGKGRIQSTLVETPAGSYRVLSAADVAREEAARSR